MLRLLFTLTLILSVVGCHNLDEEVFDRQPIEDFLDEPEDFVAFSGLAYHRLSGYARFFNLLYLQELQTDGYGRADPPT
jgi:autonomous glycyl radical cofactor GrcA